MMTTSAHDATVDLERGTVLLRQAITDPFVVTSESALAPDSPDPFAVWQWARYVGDTFPLWSFRPRAYAALHDTELPTTHPLRSIIRSIVDDDGLGDVRDPLALGETMWLELAIDGRRSGIADENGGPGFGDCVESDGEGYRFIGTFGLSFRSLADGPALAYHEPDTPHTIGGYVSPYEEIGLRLVELVEQREAAPASSAERRSADDALEKFLKDVTLTVRGHPSILRRDAAARLIAEGTALIEVCAAVLHRKLTTSERTTKILSAHGVPMSEATDWALRLALPTFSGPELNALKRELRTPRRREVERRHFPRDFAVQVLAHRLRCPVSTIARKVVDGRSAEALDVRDGTCVVCGHPH